MKHPARHIWHLGSDARAEPRHTLTTPGGDGWDEVLQEHRETRGAPISDLKLRTTRADALTFIRFRRSQ